MAFYLSVMGWVGGCSICGFEDIFLGGGGGGGCRTERDWKISLALKFILN